MQPSVRVEDLVKRYGARDALRGISFRVEAGEVVALLGPNGAGKTTTAEILEGYRARDGGHAEVLGLDPGHGGRELRERIGIVLQGTSTHPHLSALEAVQLFAGYYRRPRDPAELIGLVGLEDAAAQRVRTLSGDSAVVSISPSRWSGSPELLFLDEPTTGFDPEARRAAWETIRQLAEGGTTVLLTTHYLDEAATLADRVIVLRGGRIVAEGAPGSLGAVAARRAPLPPPRRRRAARAARARADDDRGRHRRYLRGAHRGAARPDGLGARAARRARGARACGGRAWRTSTSS